MKTPSTTAVFEFLARWCVNLSFILMTFAACYFVMSLVFRLSVEANATIAGLLTIGMSDLYLGFKED